MVKQNEVHFNMCGGSTHINRRRNNFRNGYSVQLHTESRQIFVNELFLYGRVDFNLTNPLRKSTSGNDHPEGVCSKGDDAEMPQRGVKELGRSYILRAEHELREANELDSPSPGDADAVICQLCWQFDKKAELTSRLCALCSVRGFTMLMAETTTAAASLVNADSLDSGPCLALSAPPVLLPALKSGPSKSVVQFTAWKLASCAQASLSMKPGGS